MFSGKTFTDSEVFVETILKRKTNLTTKIPQESKKVAVIGVFSAVLNNKNKFCLLFETNTNFSICLVIM